MAEAFAAIEAIHYVLTKSGKEEKLKIVKLIYLADKYHLLRWGRTITNDDYYAMEHGTVGSLTLNVLCFDDLYLSTDELEFALRLLKKVGKHELSTKNEMAIDYEYLSETDKEAIDFIYKIFGNYDKYWLRDYTHRLSEWQKHEESLNAGSKREKIDINDLFNLSNDDFNINPEHVEDAKAIYFGQY